MNTLDESIAKTEKWRSGEEHSQLFLSFIHPHKHVVFSLISELLKIIPMKSGVDTTNIKTHSTRSTSTSKASLQDASMENILKQEYWSNQST